LQNQHEGGASQAEGLAAPDDDVVLVYSKKVTLAVEGVVAKSSLLRAWSNARSMGDVGAARLTLDRIAPVRRGRHCTLEISRYR
jgi:hypothetical protein